MDENSFYGLEKLNMDFCAGAREIAIQTNFGWKRNVKTVPALSSDYSIYRSVWNADGSMLFVVDVDSYGKFEQAFYVMRAVYYMMGRRALVKSSGNKGVHLTQRIDFNSESWKKHAGEISRFPNVQSYLKATLEGLTKEIKGTTTDEKTARKKKGVCLDRKMLDRKRVIRTFSVHLKTGLYSVPVFPDDDELDDVLERAKLNTSMRLETVEIPEFNLFGLARLPGEGRRSTLARESPPEKPPVEAETQPTTPRLKYEGDVPPCVKRLLSRKGGNPTHPERFFLVSWLNDRGHSKKEILELIRSLHWSDYDANVTDYQVGQIIQRGYLMPGPAKLIDEGICTLTGACKKCVMKSLSRGGDDRDVH